MVSRRQFDPTVADPASDDAARSKAGVLLLLMIPFMVASLWLVLRAALWIAPDSMRNGDTVYVACFIGGLAFGGLTGAFVAQRLWCRYPRATYCVGLVAWIVIGVGIAILTRSK